MEPKFEALIDQRNADLFEAMDRQYHIKITEADEPGYATSFDGKNVTIEVDMDDLNPHSFTHELLHIFMKSMDVCIAQDVKEWVGNYPSLEIIFSDSLQEHLGNCLEHKKMLPLYLERGFNNERFVRDYQKKVIDDGELRELQRKYVQEGIYSSESVDTYISKFFSMKTANNPAYNYDYYYRAMENLDPELFGCLNIFWEAWLQFHIEDPKEKYQSALDRLFMDLAEWKNGKEVR